MKKRIIFVDDEPNVLQGLKRMLRPMRKEWEMTFAESGPNALEIMATQPFDVIVSDMRMPGMDGAELLSRVMTQFPDTVRIILSGQAEKEAMLRSIGPSHQYLSKPCDAETLKQTVLRASNLREILSGDRLSFVSQMKNLPSLPEIYMELVDELKSDDPSLQFISRLIEKDMGMASKILQLVNSAYFGVRRHVSNIGLAVSMLGLENVRSLVLFTNIFSNVKIDKSKVNISLENVWKHSGAVGRISRDICKHEKLDKQTLENAMSAGLLHDCGIIVLAANVEKEYGEVIKLSNQKDIPLHEAELEVLGSTHAEVGAYLLGLWGLPDELVAAVAYHHNPQESLRQEMCTITAVHVANVIDKEITDPDINHRDKLLDTDYLDSIGVLDRLETWKELITND